MRAILINSLIFVILGSLVPGAADAAKIKHLQTLYADSDGVALRLPEGVACDGRTLVVADTGNSRLVLFGLEDQSYVTKTVLPLEGRRPIVTRMNSRGDLYILDGKTREIVKLGTADQVAETLQPAGLPSPQTLIPRSFAFDGQDRLYLLDVFAERVLVLDAAGRYLRQIPFPEGAGFFTDLTIGPRGTVYLLDSVAGAIHATEPEADAFSPVTRKLKEYTNFPISLALDGQGTIFLSDQYGSGLALVSRDGAFLGRKLGLGWEDGQLYYPAQICIGGEGRLFVADRNNHRVQVFGLLED